MAYDPDRIRIQYTTQKSIKGSVLADHLAHQAVEDYQSMRFDFPDEDIMTLSNIEENRPYDGPEQGSRWTLYFDGASNALGNGIGAVLILQKVSIHLSLLDSASAAPTTWPSMKLVSLVSRLLLTWESNL